MATTTDSGRGKKPTEDKAEDRATPIVYEAANDKGGKGRGKKRYSGGTKDFQVVAEGVVDFADRLTQAVADGSSTYRKRSKASARKKRDGALRDVVDNLSEGLSDALETAAEAPRALSKKVKLKRLTRLATPQPLNVFIRR